MRKICFNIALLGALALGSQAKAQFLLEALEAPRAGDFIKITDGWEVVAQSERYLVSVRDNAYTPMSMHDLSDQPSSEGQYGSRNPVGQPPQIADAPIEYIGKISPLKRGYEPEWVANPAGLMGNYAVLIHIYKKKNDAAPLKIPTVLSTAYIPKNQLEGSPSSNKVYLKLREASDQEEFITISETTRLIAYVCSDEELRLTPLDINAGVGKTGRGVHLTTFSINIGQSNIGDMELRLVPAIPGPVFARGSFTSDEPQYFGLPLISYDNRTYMGNPIGADYMNLGHYAFNPARKYSFPYDFHGQGKVYNWQRTDLNIYAYSPDPETHRLTTFFRTPKTRTREWPDISSPLYSTFHIGTSPYLGAHWYHPNDNSPYPNNWGVSNGNKICPVGYRVPTSGEVNTLTQAKYNLNRDGKDNSWRYPIVPTSIGYGEVGPSYWVEWGDLGYKELHTYTSDVYSDSQWNDKYWTMYGGTDIALRYSVRSIHSDCDWSDYGKPYLLNLGTLTPEMKLHGNRYAKKIYDEKCSRFSSEASLEHGPIRKGLLGPVDDVRWTEQGGELWSLHISAFPSTICIRE